MKHFAVTCCMAGVLFGTFVAGWHGAKLLVAYTCEHMAVVYVGEAVYQCTKHRTTARPAQAGADGSGGFGTKGKENDNA